MNSAFGGIGLVLAIAALGVASYALMQDRGTPSDFEVRLEALEARLVRVERTAEGREIEERTEATLRGLRTEAETPAGMPVRGAAQGTPQSGDTTAGTTGTAPEGTVARTTEEIQELVDEAVTKKAEQIQSMRDKKPPLDTFARTLQLTDEQRVIAEQEILHSQQEIRAILETPTEDGTNLVDELVEVLAEGIARPGEKTGRGMKFFGRLLTENVPGTGETYAAQAEAVKTRLRDSFRRDWSEEQYKTFESWGMDPTEVKDIEGSPWNDLEPRVLERARQMGADIPQADRR